MIRDDSPLTRERIAARLADGGFVAAIVRLTQLAGRRVPALTPALAALGVVLLLGQGVVYSLHSALTLSRTDTRNATRDWLVANVEPGTKIVVEPVVPDAWATDIGHPYRGTANGARWSKFPTSRTNVADDGTVKPGAGEIVNIEDYERALRPELVDLYAQRGYCWVVVGSTQRGRAEAQPKVVPGAIAYYRALEQRAQLVFDASPYREDAGPVKFNFDWTFDYYPLAYARPGPQMQVFHLRGGTCS